MQHKLELPTIDQTIPPKNVFKSKIASSRGSGSDKSLELETMIFYHASPIVKFVVYNDGSPVGVHDSLFTAMQHYNTFP